MIVCACSEGAAPRCVEVGLLGVYEMMVVSRAGEVGLGFSGLFEIEVSKCNGHVRNGETCWFVGYAGKRQLWYHY